MTDQVQTIPLQALLGTPTFDDSSGPALYIWASQDGDSVSFNAWWVGTNSSKGYDYDLEVVAQTSGNVLRFANISAPMSNLNSTVELSGDKKAEPQTATLEYKGWVGPNMDGLEFAYPTRGDELTFDASTNLEGFGATQIFVGEGTSLASLGVDATEFAVVVAAA